MEKYLSYKDVCLVPKYSELNSRAEADVSVNLCGYKFRSPAIPANMESVIDEKLAYYLSENSYFYIMHRFNVNLFNFVQNAQDWKLISISCGVNDNTAESDSLWHIHLKKLRVDFITIDVAMGDHIKVKNRIKWLKEILPNTKIIAGNIATPQAAKHLIEWGANIIKAGISGGSICTTKNQTGFHVPMFSCVKNIYDKLHPNDYIKQCGSSEKFYVPYAEQINIPIIADGSISNIGDIAKSINAGATMTMCGKLFAECIDSPAKIINGKKLYFGSTSFEAKKENKNIEGISLEIEAGVTVAERLKEIEMALQSSISYAGGKQLSDLRNVDYIRI